MKIPKLPPLTGDAKGYAVLLGVGALVAVGLFMFAKKQVKEAAAAAGGIVSGNNAITEGTPYEGAGLPGTLGATVNAASGGVLQSIGERLGGWLYDITHEPYDPNATPDSRKQAVADNFYDRGAL